MVALLNDSLGLSVVADVENADQALRETAANKPDVVVLDIAHLQYQLQPQRLAGLGLRPPVVRDGAKWLRSLDLLESYREASGSCDVPLLYRAPCGARIGDLAGIPSQNIFQDLVGMLADLRCLGWRGQLFVDEFQRGG